MRIVFCASGSFAVPTLQALLNGRHDVAAIFTQPARPAGRGGHLRPTPVSEAAEEAEIRAVECRNINADEKLKKVFGGKKQVNMFEMTKLVAKHLS